MEKFEDICSKYVTATDDGSVPAINSVIAGFTDSESTQFLTAKGVANIETNEPISIDSTVRFFSCTKSMTAMAILILWEKGLVNLDTPASQYLPILDEFGIVDDLDMIDENTGDFIKPPRKPKNPVTIRNLLLHNSGFTYNFPDNPHGRIYGRIRKHKLPTREISMEIFHPEIMPLVSEPGSQWIYGYGIDWVGLIVEAVSGQKLSQFLTENVFKKAEIESITFDGSTLSSLISLHDKSDGKLKLHRGHPLVSLTNPVDMGGQGSFGKVGDYLKFLRIWLNYGLCKDTGHRILKKETVEFARQNHLPSDNYVLAPGSDPEDGYSLLGCAYNTRDLSTGRGKGSVYWSGLANLYFWVDFENDCAGFWGCQIIPFKDPSCWEGYREFETAVYDHLKKTKA